MSDLDSILNFQNIVWGVTEEFLDSHLNILQNGMSGAEAPGPDAVAQAEEAKARANEFFKTEKYPLVFLSIWVIFLCSS